MPISGTLTFNSSEIQKIISVSVTGDLVDEFNETFRVELSTIANVDVLDAQAIGTIVDNDGLSALSIADRAILEGNSGSKDDSRAAPGAGDGAQGLSPHLRETFISNEILLLEQLGFAVRIFSMRRGRERFAHESVARIRAAVDYLPETFLRNAHRLLFHNLCLAIHRTRHFAADLAVACRRFQP